MLNKDRYMNWRQRGKINYSNGLKGENSSIQLDESKSILQEISTKNNKIPCTLEARKTKVFFKSYDFYEF